MHLVTYEKSQRPAIVPRSPVPVVYPEVQGGDCSRVSRSRCIPRGTCRLLFSGLPLEMYTQRYRPTIVFESPARAVYPEVQADYCSRVSRSRCIYTQRYRSVIVLGSPAPDVYLNRYHRLTDIGKKNSSK